MNVKQLLVSAHRKMRTLVIYHGVEVASNGMNVHIYSQDTDVKVMVVFI